MVNEFLMGPAISGGGYVRGWLMSHKGWGEFHNDCRYAGC